jgi:xylulokinase
MGAIQGLGEGASESDPNMWVEAVNILLQNLRISKGQPNTDLVAMSVSGQQHGLVALVHQEI